MLNAEAKILSSSFHGPNGRFQMDRMADRFGGQTFIVSDLDNPDPDCPDCPNIVGNGATYDEGLKAVNAAIVRLCGDYDCWA